MDFKKFCEDEKKHIHYLEEYRNLLKNSNKKTKTESIVKKYNPPKTEEKGFFGNPKEPAKNDFQKFVIKSYDSVNLYTEQSGPFNLCEKCNGRPDQNHFNSSQWKTKKKPIPKSPLPEHLLGRVPRKVSTSSSESSLEEVKKDCLYKIIVKTNSDLKSGTDARVFIRLVDKSVQSDPIELKKNFGSLKYHFAPNSTEIFYVKAMTLGDLQTVNIKLEAENDTDEWYPDWISIEELLGEKRKWTCKNDRFLSGSRKDCKLIAKLKAIRDFVPKINYQIEIKVAHDSVDECYGLLNIILIGGERKTEKLKLENKKLSTLKSGSTALFTIEHEEVGALTAICISIMASINSSESEDERHIKYPTEKNKKDGSSFKNLKEKDEKDKKEQKDSRYKQEEDQKQDKKGIKSKNMREQEQKDKSERNSNYTKEKCINKDKDKKKEKNIKDTQRKDEINSKEADNSKKTKEKDLKVTKDEKEFQHPNEKDQNDKKKILGTAQISTNSYRKTPKRKGWEDIKIDSIRISWIGSDTKTHEVEFLMNKWIGLSDKMTQKSIILKNPNVIKKKSKQLIQRSIEENTTYNVTFFTSKKTLAGTDATVYIKFFGKYNVWSKTYEFVDYNKKCFEKGKEDSFRVSGPNVGTVTKINVWHSDTGVASGWKPEKVIVVRHLTPSEICEVLEDMKKRSNLPKEIKFQDGKVLLDCKNLEKNIDDEVVHQNSGSVKRKHGKKLVNDSDYSSTSNNSDSDHSSTENSKGSKQHKTYKNPKSFNKTFSLPYAEETRFDCSHWLSEKKGKNSLNQIFVSGGHSLLCSPINLNLHLDN